MDLFDLSCVYGSVTNNNGFWIGWFDLLTSLLQSLLIAINYSAIANLPTAKITRTRSILVLRCTPFYSFNSHSRSSKTASFGTRLSYIHFARTSRKTFCIIEKDCSPCLDLLCFFAFASKGIYLAICCLAMGIGVTISCRVNGDYVGGEKKKY
jgi:hypothetical protein